MLVQFCLIFSKLYKRYTVMNKFNKYISLACYRKTRQNPNKRLLSFYQAFCWTLDIIGLRHLPFLSITKVHHCYMLGKGEKNVYLYKLTIFSSLEKAIPVQRSVCFVVIVNLTSLCLAKYCHWAAYSHVLFAILQFLGNFHSALQTVDEDVLSSSITAPTVLFFVSSEIYISFIKLILTSLYPKNCYHKSSSLIFLVDFHVRDISVRQADKILSQTLFLFLFQIQENEHNDPFPVLAPK